MDWELNGWALVLGIVALLATIIFGIGQMRRAKQYGNQRAKLAWNQTTTSLVHPSSQGSLRVSHDGVVVHDPYLVRFELSNVGPRDVASVQFDQGKPLTIAFTGTLLALLKAEPAGVAVEQEAGTVSVAPFLLPRGKELSFELLLEGPPQGDPKISPLVDTDIDYLSSESLVAEVARVTAVGVLGTLIVPMSLGRGFRRGA